jgi:hypothetical protein
MPLITWNTVEFYDPATAEDAIMYLGFSGHGTYSIKRPATLPGKSRRQQKNIALDAIEAAIDAGDEPGNVSEKHWKAAEERYLARSAF